MLRSALAALLSGLALVLAVYALVTNESVSSAAPDSRLWGPGDFRIVAGEQLRRDGPALAVQLDEQGRAIVEVDADNLELAALPLLHLEFYQRPDVLAMIIASRTDERGARPTSRRVGVSPGSSFWLDMRQYGDWSGRPSDLAVIFLGPPGGEVRLQAMSLNPPVFPATLFVDLTQWTTFVPWTHASINSHLGLLSPGGAPYPAVGAALVLATASIVYLLAVFVSRGRIRFRWSALGVITAFCWLALDWSWQNKLLRQSDVTRATFAGKSNAEKRQAGPDSALFGFTRRVNDVVSESDGRVFISTTSDYQGMRGAYFLYPNNVYWDRYATTLPDPDYFEAGDFVVLFPPVQVGYDRNSGYLQYGDGKQLRAEILFSEGSGALFRAL
jgi:hypothetical protein